MNFSAWSSYKLRKKLHPRVEVPAPVCRKSRFDSEEKRHVVRLEVSDPSQLVVLICSLTCNNSKELERRVNKYLQHETESQTAFLVSVTKEEAYVQVIGAKKLDRILRYKIKQSVIDEVCEMCVGENPVLPDDWNTQIKEILRDVIRDDSCNVVSVPVITTRHQMMAFIMVCLVNPKKDVPYVVRLVNETFRFCLSILLNTSTSEEEAKTKRECQMLLAVARKLFTHLGSLNDLLQEIMSEARNLANAERCSLFLVEDQTMLVAKVFDGSTLEASKEVKIPINLGIAGYVATTGEILNIKDAYSHPLFYKSLDETTGFKTRNMLCFPIQDENGIIGVGQLCNKKEGDFTLDDEEVAMTFSVYCGLSIMHSLVYKKTQDAQTRTQLCNELMMYHMKVDEEAVTNFLRRRILPAIKHFDEFTFLPRNVSITETPYCILLMFDKLNFLETFNIKKDLLARFVLFVQKGYRDTPYHNWCHAFTVTHFCYLVIKNCKLVENEIISPLEALCLVVACLGHDIDHRGTTNSFQLKTGSPLASLYSSEGSVMERHHLSQTLCILNSENCNFLGNLDNESYRKCIDLLKDNILATDLATHMKILPKMQEMLKDGYTSEKEENKKLLMSLIMTCSDLSDQTKDWGQAKRVAQLVYEEFFHQGDLEKKMGNEPLDMMNREKASIPDLQIQFLNEVCLPAFSCLATVFPMTEDLLAVVKNNVKSWETSKTVFEKNVLEGKLSLEVLMSATLEEEVAIEMENQLVSIENEDMTFQNDITEEIYPE